jgi:putative GTP pyrophosphokinase
MPEYTGPRYESLHSRAFEIQVRTLAMDAWSTISHYLDYKTKADIPKELRRDFYALSGLFYVADTHFEMFFKAREEAIKRTKQLVNNPDTEMHQEINLDSLKAYLAKEFSGRKTAPAFYISPLVSELKEASYETIGQLDAAIFRGREAFLEFERDYPHSSGKYSDVGALKTILEIVDPNFARVRGLAEEWNRKMEKYRQLIKPA